MVASDKTAESVLKIDLNEDHLFLLALVVAVGDVLGVPDVSPADENLFEGRLAKAIATLQGFPEFEALRNLVSKLETDRRRDALKVAVEAQRRSFPTRRGQHPRSVAPMRQDGAIA